MEAYTDRVIIKNVSKEETDHGIFKSNSNRDFKSAEVVSAGMSPSGQDNSKLEGRRILFFDNTPLLKLPLEGELYLIKRTSIEVVL